MRPIVAIALVKASVIFNAVLSARNIDKSLALHSILFILTFRFRLQVKV
jgi:hypothetical protein